MEQTLHDVAQDRQADLSTPPPHVTLDEPQKRALVEIMPSACFTCDADGLITYYNQHAAELWGRQPRLHDPEDRYCGALKLFLPDGTHLPHDQCAMAQAIRTGCSTRNTEVHILRPDGTTIIVQANIDPLLDENGERIGAINVFEDITNRKEAEAVLRTSEERLRLATTAGQIGIFDYDLRTHAVYLSPLYRAITRVDKPSLTMADWLPLVHPDDRAKVEQTVAQAIQDGKPYHYEYRIFWPDGTLRWLEVHGLLDKDANGQPIRLTGAMRDVTERKQTEERLATLYHLRRDVNRSSDLAQTFEHALDALESVLGVDRAAVLHFDHEGVMRFHTAHGLSAQYREQVEGHSPWRPEEENPQSITIADVQAATGLGTLQSIILAEAIQAIAFIPLVEQGKLLGKFMLYYNQPHAFSQAEIEWAETLARDIAHAIQRKQSEEEMRRLNATLEERVAARTLELQRSNRELEQFAYVASHDLKAPLRGISQLAEWISEDAAALLPDASKEHLNKLSGRVKRMEMLLNDLLAYSRAGRQRHKPEMINIAEVVQDVVADLAPPAGFAIHVIEPIPTLRAERVPLELLFRCLLGNAVKHHHDPVAGCVEIMARVQNEVIEFVIKDNGPGIDPQFHQRIFEIFQTLKPRDQVEGSGIGLALVKKLVESRGGEVAVESNVGEGATFRITWPL